MPLAVGTRAPEFTLKTRKDGVNADVSLSDSHGKPIVLLFFPGAFTGVCTQEFCDRTAGIGAYSMLDAVVYGISVDSVFAQEAWAKQNQIEVALLADYKHEVTRAYDVVWPDFAGMGPSAARAAFVIGRDGTIVYSEQTAELGQLPNLAAVQAALESA